MSQWRPSWRGECQVISQKVFVELMIVVPHLKAQKTVSRCSPIGSSGHLTELSWLFWDQNNASVDLCQRATTIEQTAWKWRYNSAFCLHHLPPHPPAPTIFTCDRSMCWGLRLSVSGEFTWEKQYYSDQVDSTFEVFWHQNHQDQKTLRQVKIIAPTLWTYCCGQSFRRPFLTSPPNQMGWQTSGGSYLLGTVESRSAEEDPAAEIPLSPTWCWNDPSVLVHLVLFEFINNSVCRTLLPWTLLSSDHVKVEHQSSPRVKGPAGIRSEPSGVKEEKKWIWVCMPQNNQK